MLKRITSIGLVLIMAFAMAAPVLHIDCDMPCCEVKKMTCCDKEKKADSASKECTMRNESCEHSKFVPIVSGPKSKQKSAKVDMAKPTCSLKASGPKCQLNQKTAVQGRSSAAQAKSAIPLRL